MNHSRSYVSTALFALAMAAAAPAAVTVTHNLSAVVTTTASAMLSNLSGNPPSIVFTNAAGAVSGAFTSSAAGQIAIHYEGYTVFDEYTFGKGSAHRINFQAGSWGITDGPSGPAVGRSGSTNEAIVFRFDTSGLALNPGQSLVLVGVQGGGNYPQYSVIVRNDGGSTTQFAAGTNGLTGLNLTLADDAEFAYIHNSSTGGSRLAQIILDIVSPIAASMTAVPDAVAGTNRTVTLHWISSQATTNSTVELSADKPAVFGPVDGDATDGHVTAIIADGANGDVTFRATIRDGETVVAEASVQVKGYAIPSGGPNLLLITVDDMSCSSIGVFGCPLADTTPNIDALAASGLRFTRAHVVSANCMPSRNVIMSGLYPHTNGVEGFDKVPGYTHLLLPDLLERLGYYRAIFHKVSHSTPAAYPWDLVPSDSTELPLKDPRSYYKVAKQAILSALAAGKPLFANLNIADPHLPFYGIKNQSTNLVYDPYVPSRLFSPAEVPVPDFLPGDGDVPLELAHYYMSVRRADDGVGAILEALDEFQLRDHTLIVFLSDHGMPEPFAKACLYHNSTRTPLIFSWPGVIAANTVNETNMVSTIDLLPTLLDALGSPYPYGLQGKSFYRALLGEPVTGFDHVIKEHNQVSSGVRQPMRGVQTRRYGYLWNPWSNGSRDVRNATEGSVADQRMEALAAAGDPYWSARDNLFEYRQQEEFYDYENDPDALTNLIGRAELQSEIEEHRQLLRSWMERTWDHALDAFVNRTNAAAVEAYVLSQSDAPPVVSEFTSLERMMEHLEIDVSPADWGFHFAIDTRLPTATWEMLTTDDLTRSGGVWTVSTMTNSTVSFDPITGQVDFIPEGSPHNRQFFQLKGTVPE